MFTVQTHHNYTAPGKFAEIKEIAGVESNVQFAQMLADDQERGVCPFQKASCLLSNVSLHRAHLNIFVLAKVVRNEPKVSK